MFWAAGHLSANATPSQAYLQLTLQAWEQAHVPGHLFGNPFVYPPTTLLLTVPLAALDYWPSYVLWSTSLIALSILALRSSKLPWPVIIAGLLSPAVLFDITLGQLGLVAGALSLAALLRFEGTPIRAGILAGLAAIKPQDGVVVPFAMLARSRHRSILAGALVIQTMLLLATLVFGPKIWIAYLRHGNSTSDALLMTPAQGAPGTSNHGAYRFYFITLYWMLRSLRLRFMVSLVGQIIAAIAAIAIIFRAWHASAANPLARVGLTVFLGSFLTPYAFVLDLGGYSIMIAALAWQRRRLTCADAVLFTWPGYAPFVSAFLHVSLTPLFIAGAAVRAWAMMKRSVEMSTE